eukprot:680417-Rhodomonas_salina.2
MLLEQLCRRGRDLGHLLDQGPQARVDGADEAPDPGPAIAASFRRALQRQDRAVDALHKRPHLPPVPVAIRVEDESDLGRRRRGVALWPEHRAPQLAQLAAERPRTAQDLAAHTRAQASTRSSTWGPCYIQNAPTTQRRKHSRTNIVRRTCAMASLRPAAGTRLLAAVSALRRSCMPRWCHRRVGRTAGPRAAPTPQPRRRRSAGCRPRSAFFAAALLQPLSAAGPAGRGSRGTAHAPRPRRAGVCQQSCCLRTAAAAACP